MSRRITAVEVSYDKLSELGIEVGSPDWFGWLECNRSFHYSCSKGHFTANKNSKGYWYAQRRVRGELLQHYMGQTAKLTLESLLDAAEKLALAEINNRPSNKLVRVLEEQSCKSCMTEEERLRQLSKEELIELTAHLKNQLHDYKTQPKDSSQTGEGITQLKAELERVTQDRDNLLIKLGNQKIQAHEDAKVRIDQLEKRVTELDNANWEMQKQYTVVDELAQRRERQLHELRAECDRLKTIDLKSLNDERAKIYQLRHEAVIHVKYLEALGYTVR